MHAGEKWKGKGGEVRHVKDSEKRKVGADVLGEEAATKGHEGEITSAAARRRGYMIHSVCGALRMITHAY